MPVSGLEIGLGIFSLVLTLHSLFSLYLTLYAWDDPERMEEAAAPKSFEKPRHGFSVFLPCRNEEAVIGDTLVRLSQANYPIDKFELLVLCTPDDEGTIRAAKRAIREHDIKNARIICFPLPAGKSRGMNIALEHAAFDLVTIFDSEDDVSADIFQIANTLYIRRPIDVLQCGVQLMDYDTRWYSAHNVLEYFFWFKSRMHVYAKTGIVPLGGNSVFFRTANLKDIGGWDEHGLCEDADIGIRLSRAGRRFGVMYDSRHVTREETPHTIPAFIKQRTRWNQGFLQIVKKGDWRGLSGFRQIALIMFILFGPAFMATVVLTTPVVLLFGIVFKVNVGLSLLTYLPLFLSFVTLLISLLGLHEFGKEQKKQIGIKDYFRLVLTFLPYQFLLGYSAFRAGWRELVGNRGWEKTQHLGTHRSGTGTSVSSANITESKTKKIATKQVEPVIESVAHATSSKPYAAASGGLHYRKNLHEPRNYLRTGERRSIEDIAI